MVDENDDALIELFSFLNVQNASNNNMNLYSKFSYKNNSCIILT